MSAERKPDYYFLDAEAKLRGAWVVFRDTLTVILDSDAPNGEGFKRFVLDAREFNGMLDKGRGLLRSWDPFRYLRRHGWADRFWRQPPAQAASIAREIYRESLVSAIRHRETLAQRDLDEAEKIRAKLIALGGKL